MLRADAALLTRPCHVAQVAPSLCICRAMHLYRPSLACIRPHGRAHVWTEAFVKPKWELS